MGIEDLYKYYEILDKAKDKAGEHESEYLAIVAAVKGSSQEKRLASQFIAKFFKHFPKHGEQTLNAMFDLCEDDDVAIRKQAIKDLPSLCKDVPAYLQRISIVLTQLLQAEDANEQNLVNMSLMAVLKQNTKETITGIFSQVAEAGDVLRDRALKFLTNKLKLLPEDAITKDVEEIIVAESKKVLVDVTGTEFVLLIKLLHSLKVMQTLLGRQQLVEIITEQADLDTPFNASDVDAVDRLVQCVTQALPLLSKNVHATKLMTHMCDQVVPSISLIQTVTTGGEGDTPTVTTGPLDVLKLVAEMSVFAWDMKDVDVRLAHLYTTLLEYMPVAPAPGTDAKDEPKLDFSHVECLLFTFHQLARHKPDFLTSDEARLKEFRTRLQYFAHRTQLYVKDLKASVAGKKPGDKSEEVQVKNVALKVTNNITALIKDLFHTPPAYKTVVTLSWKTPTKETTTPVTAPTTTPTAGAKRQAIEAPTGPKAEVKRYAPPTGKFSEKAGGFRGRGGRGGGRGGGGRGYGRQGYWT